MPLHQRLLRLPSRGPSKGGGALGNGARKQRMVHGIVHRINVMDECNEMAPSTEWCTEWCTEAQNGAGKHRSKGCKPGCVQEGKAQGGVLMSRVGQFHTFCCISTVGTVDSIGNTVPRACHIRTWPTPLMSHQLPKAMRTTQPAPRITHLPPHHDSFSCVRGATGEEGASSDIGQGCPGLSAPEQQC